MATDKQAGDLQRYVKLKPTVDKTAGKYFTNMFAIQELWETLVRERFSSREHRDQLWGLCQKGMQLAWKWRSAELEQMPELTPPRDFPCYTRAIMLLEKEGRFAHAVVLCDETLKWTPDSEWYLKKKDTFLKKLAEQENNRQ